LTKQPPAPVRIDSWGEAGTSRERQRGIAENLGAT
jgi:hypothetical protein